MKVSTVCVCVFFCFNSSRCKIRSSARFVLITSWLRSLSKRSDVTSQHSLGLISPADTAGWGPASPLPWLAEEVKVICRAVAFLAVMMSA